MSDIKKSVALFLVLTFAIIIGVNFLIPTANTISSVTHTIIVRNLTVTPLAGANTTVQLPGREWLSTIQIVNATNSSRAETMNFSIATRYGTDGLLHVFLVRNDTVGNIGNVNVSYTANPDGFVEGGSSVLVQLITLFVVLGIVIFVVTKIIKDEKTQNIIHAGAN